MMMRSVFLAVVASGTALGQTLPARPEFEVASIRPSAPAVERVNLGVHIDGARVSCTYLSLKDYIRIAYRLKDYQVLGPDWLASERFDIAATLPAGAAREQVPDMIQALLAERFQMKLHRDTKEFPVYGLVPGKGGLKMKESPLDADADSGEPGRGEAGRGAVNVTASGGRGGTTVNFGRGSSFTFANNRFEARKLAMPGFADTLTRFVDRPVVNMTELTGNYDFTLELSPEDFRAMTIRSAIAAGVVLPPQALQLLDGVSGDSLFTALQTLGLKMEPRKAPLEVLVIDHISRVPTEN
jgi:uncharacterized protein (TIGR03435 family)